MADPKRVNLERLKLQYQEAKAKGNDAGAIAFSKQIKELQDQIARADSINKGQGDFAGGGPSTETPRKQPAKESDDENEDDGAEGDPTPDFGEIGSAISDAEFAEMNEEKNRTAEEAEAQLQREVERPKAPQQAASETPGEPEVKPSVDGVKPADKKESKGQRGSLEQNNISEGKRAAGKVSSTAKDIGKQAGDWIKKQAGSLIKKIASNPAAWPWIIGIALALIILGLGIAFLAHGVGKANSGEMGTTFTQDAGAYTDKEWLRKLLFYAKDPATMNQITTQMLADFRTALTDISLDPAVAPEDQAKAKDLLLKVEMLSNPISKAIMTQAAKDLKAGIGELILKYSPCSAVSVDTTFFVFDHADERADLFDGILVRHAESNGGTVAVSHNLCRFLIMARNNAQAIGITQIRVSTIAGYHKRYASAGVQSQHWIGQGLDIGNQEIAPKLVPWIFSNITAINAAGIKIHQVIGPTGTDWMMDNKLWPLPHDASLQAQHNNHLHMGF